MKGYWAIFKIRWKTLVQYRVPYLAGIATQLFWGLILTAIMRAFYMGSSSAEPFALDRAITFIWIGQALLQLLPWNLDRAIEQEIKNGNVAYELLRPLSLYGLWFVRSLALRLVPTLLRSLPIFVLGGWCLSLGPPASVWSLCAFLLATLAACLLSASITTLAVISLFWTLSGEGVQRLLPSCAVLLSGVAVPLPLFPNWMQPILSIQPLRGIIDIPCRLYTGLISPQQAPFYLLFQLVWASIFMFLGIWLLKKALRQFVTMGG